MASEATLEVISDNHARLFDSVTANCRHQASPPIWSITTLPVVKNALETPVYRLLLCASFNCPSLFQVLVRSGLTIDACVTFILMQRHR